MLQKTILFQVNDLGLIDYKEAYAIQKNTVDRVIAGAPQKLILCEHPAVLTMGRLAADKHLLILPADLHKKGVDVISIDRGGEVTLHSPGQLVIYPIFDLNHYGRNLKLYLHKLEQVAVALLRDFGILAKCVPGYRGVWVQSQKIASIGIGVRKWISYHGLAINVNTDLNLFAMINPCGLNIEMTSMEKLKDHKILMDSVKEKIITHFENEFKY